MNSDPDLKARNQRKLLMNTHREAGTDCLVWDGQVSNAGYGRVMLKTDQGNQTLSAARAAFQLFVGPLHKDKIVLQRCHNRLCVNPDHLELVDEIPHDHWRQG